MDASAQPLMADLQYELEQLASVLSDSQSAKQFDTDGGGVSTESRDGDATTWVEDRSPVVSRDPEVVFMCPLNGTMERLYFSRPPGRSTDRSSLFPSPVNNESIYEDRLMHQSSPKKKASKIPSQARLDNLKSGEESLRQEICRLQSQLHAQREKIKEMGQTILQQQRFVEISIACERFLKRKIAKMETLLASTADGEDERSDGYLLSEEMSDGRRKAFAPSDSVKRRAAFLESTAGDLPQSTQSTSRYKVPQWMTKAAREMAMSLEANGIENERSRATQTATFTGRPQVLSNGSFTGRPQVLSDGSFTGRQQVRSDGSFTGRQQLSCDGIKLSRVLPAHLNDLCRSPAELYAAPCTSRRNRLSEVKQRSRSTSATRIRQVMQSIGFLGGPVVPGNPTGYPQSQTPQPTSRSAGSGFGKMEQPLRRHSPADYSRQRGPAQENLAPSSARSHHRRTERYRPRNLEHCTPQTSPQVDARACLLPCTPHQAHSPGGRSSEGLPPAEGQDSYFYGRLNHLRKLILDTKRL